LNKKSVIFFLFSLVAFAACRPHYSLSGITIPAEAKTVSVQYFQNLSSLAPPTYSQQFTEALRDKLSAQTRLALVSKGGDLSFDGNVTNYYTSPIAIQSTDQAALNRLTITVNVKYACAFDEKKNFEQSFTRYSDYNSTQSLAEVETELIQLINDQLTQDICNRALNDW
jgi:hypothetical protein